MKVSIAIPSLNYARFLPACLDSCASQTHRNIEVLIADGGSNDGSVDIIERYCAHDSRFKLVSRADNGQAHGINLALGHATGDVVCFLNADDLYLSNDVLAKVSACFDEDPDLGLLSMGGMYINSEGKTLRPVCLRYHPFDTQRWMKWRTVVLQPATFWKAQISKEHPFSTRFHFVFDVEFYWYVFQRYRWHQVEVPVAGYRLHDANKSTSVREDRIRELADFERIKFGDRSLRARLLDGVATVVAYTNETAHQAVYYSINSLAFLSCYRLPGI